MLDHMGTSLVAAALTFTASQCCRVAATALPHCEDGRNMNGTQAFMNHPAKCHYGPGLACMAGLPIRSVGRGAKSVPAAQG